MGQSPGAHSLIRQVLCKLQSNQGTLLTLVAPLWPQKEWYPDLLFSGSTCRPTFTTRSAQTAPCPSSAPEPPHTTASCVESVERFARHLGLSHRVTRQLASCRRPSSRKLYQHRWEVYRRWCTDRGHSVSSPSIAKITDFLLFLRKKRHLPLPSILFFRATVSSVFKFILPEIRDSFILSDLIHSFELEHPLRPLFPPSWDLVWVLSFLRGGFFEPLSSCSLLSVDDEGFVPLVLGHC